MRFIRAEDEAALPILRHDCAHVMAEAVQDLYPGTQVTIGPPVEDGFYYDFARNEPFHPEDLERIEARMAEIVAADKPFRREVVSREEARRRFEAQGEHYKLELLDDIPEGEPITLYHQDDWFDLCRGPHGPSTGRIGAFKLLKVAGAYWRGDSRNAMLQRIYGTAWPTRKQLDEYLHRLEEAERRDHRRLGKALDLFHFQEEAAGSAFWHPKGLDALPRGRGLCPAPPGCCRLCRGQDAAAAGPDVVGGIRPLGEVRRAHVRARGRAQDARA